jgi:serine/threonine protein kinase
MNPGLIGGIVGGIAGGAGGLLGTYFSIKNTKGPLERAFVIKASIACWIFVLVFVFGMCPTPGLYKLFLIPIYVVGLVASILLWNKKQAQIRLEESKKNPAAPPTQITHRQCPQCGAELKPDVSEGLCPACLLQRGIATEGGAPPGTPPFVPPTIPDLARLFPQLEILELIGKGGMGAVYKARQPALDRLVALKILAPRSGGDLDFAERFTREARALAKLSHPNIVGVYDFGIVGQASSLSPSEKKNLQSETGRMPVPLHYFIMEYVDGPNLRQVEQAGKLSPREALEIIPQICAALQFAHDEGIVHRDIKPENVLLDKKGRVKIADFGLAKILGQEPKDFRLTGVRDVVGTPHYMAPEQLEKPQTVDHRADIYSLGVVFYEMLTGELPLGKFQPPSSCARGVQIDVRLDEVVLHALEKAPERRYQQASQVKTAVETIAGSSNRTSGPAPSKPDKTSPAYAALFFAGLSGILGITVFCYFPYPPVALVWSILVAALAGVTLGIRARKTRIGKQAVIVGSINAAIWLGVALAVHRTSFQISEGLQPMIEPRATNAPGASAETWSPTLSSDEKPDLQKILDEAKTLMSRGRYEESLQRHIWHFNHAPEFGDSYQSVVRLASGLSDWEELGRRYPKAKQALIEIRDGKTQKIVGGGGYSEMFQEVQAINRELQDDDATYVLFKTIHKQDPKLAHQSYFYVEDLLVSKGDYELCLACIGDPQARFKFYLDSLERQKESQQRMDEMKKNLPASGPHRPSGAFAPPDMGRMATNTFIGDVHKLIEILIGAGRKTDAEKIQAQAILVLDDPRLKSAVSDAELKIQKSNSVQTLAEQPPVVVETQPLSGARDVPPGETEIRVRFSKEMTDGGWSWSTAWENSTPETVGQIHYETDQRTCVLQAKLEPGRTYAWWLNSEKFRNFTDRGGRAAVPYLLIFQTKQN